MVDFGAKFAHLSPLLRPPYKAAFRRVSVWLATATKKFQKGDVLCDRALAGSRQPSHRLL